MKYPYIHLDNVPTDIVNQYLCVEYKRLMVVVKPENVLEIRDSGSLKHKSYFLDSDYDWIVVRDNEGTLVLVPLYKKEGE